MTDYLVLAVFEN